MLLKLPLSTSAEALKAKNATAVLSLMASGRKFRSRELASMTGVSRKGIRKLLRTLLQAGVIEKVGRAYQCTPALSGSGIIVNLRDVRTRLLFKPKLLYDLLLSLHFTDDPLLKIASELRISYRTAKRLLRRLRTLGLVEGFEVNPALILQPADPLELIPRDEHRLAVKEFLQLAPEAPDCALIFFGDASFGLKTSTLNFLILFPATIRPEELTSMMERYVIAASSITEAHGLSIDLTFAVKDVWLEQKLGMLLVDNALLKQAQRGICLRGKLPDKDDYFELHRLARPVSPTRLAELLAKGYVKQEGARYVYTEKALRTMRAKAPTLIEETQVPILGKNVRLLKAERPEDAV